MKKITGSVLFVSAVFGMAACGSATNSNVVVTNKMPDNMAVVVNNNSNMVNANMSNMNSMNSMNSNNAVNGNMSSSLSDDDKKFFNDAAQGGMAEVKLGELAAKNGTNAEVKSFGNKMVQEHSNANTELKSLAGKKSVTLPTDVNSEQKATYDKLAKLTGAEFDKEYVAAMVAGHEKDLAAFKKEASEAKDSDLKTFAAKYTPIVSGHTEMIKAMRAKMK